MFTGYFTFAADVIPEGRRTEGLALFGISGIVPIVLNPLAQDAGVEASDIRFYIPAVGGLVLLSMGFVAAVREPPRHPRGTEPAGFRAAVGALLRRRLWPVWLAAVVFSGLVAVFYAFATVTAEVRGVERPSYVWFSYAAGAIGVRLLGARVPDRVGPANLVAPALAAYAAGCLVAAEAHDTGGFLLAGFLAGLGHGYGFPVLSGQAVSRTPPHLRGSGVAAYTGLWDLSALAIAPAFGAFADRFGDGAMFSLAAVVAAATLVLWVALEHRHGGAAPPPA
jgi:predicted MFS family arabinose efflux permease